MSLKTLWVQVRAEEGLQWANVLHKKIFITAVSVVVILLTLAVIFNVAGWGMLNVALAIIAFVTGAFFATKPEAIAAMFAGGAVINGLPNFSVGDLFRNGLAAIPDFKLREFIAAGFEFVVLYVKGVAHVFNLVGFTAILLVYAPIGHRPIVAFLLLAIAMGFGVYALLFASEFVWLKRINRWILIGGLGYAALLLIPAQTYLAWGIPASWFTDGEERVVATQIVVSAKENQGDAIEKSLRSAADALKSGKRLSGAEIDQALGDIRKAAYTAKERELLAEAETVVGRGTIPSAVKEFFRGKVIEYQVPENIAPENLKPICGIPPGEYEFQLGGSPSLEIRNPDGLYFVRLYGRESEPGFYRPDYFSFGVMVNGSRIGDRVVVGKDTCVHPSFNLSAEHEHLFKNKEWTVGRTVLNVLLK